ncbi:unnamed protein product [Wickerhamomyces anomalus]
MSIKLPFKARLSKIPNAPITLFLHGFLGSHKNYIRLTRHIHKTLNHSTYSMDFRNHGDAPHIFPMDYSTLTSDIQSFCNVHSLHKVNIVGYSMGAKVGMSLALQNPNLVEKLICIDNAPVQKEIGPEFERYLSGLREVGEFVIRISIRMMLQFDDEVLKDLGDFPHYEHPTETKSLFIRGLKSGFVDDQGVEAIKKFFPNNEIIDIKATHDGLLSKHGSTIEKLIIKFLQ